jgi:lysophospholipase L1-like esterase
MSTRTTQPSRVPWLGTATVLVAVLTLLAGCGAPTAGAGATTTTARDAQRATTTYVAIGASDAFGIGTDDPDRDNWPTILAGTLGPSVHLINLGIPDATVAVAQQEELSVALDNRPNIVTVWLAVNDLTDGVPLATYSQQLRSLLHDLHTRTHARVFVGNVPDLALLPRFTNLDPGVLATQVAQWNAAIAADCAAESAHLVDLYSGWNELAQHPEYVAPDGLHPSTAGSFVLAGIFAAAISQAPQG